MSSPVDPSSTDAFKVWVSAGPRPNPTYKGREGVTLRNGRDKCKTALISKYGPPDSDEVRKHELCLAEYPRDANGPGYDFSTASSSIKIENAEIQALIALLNGQIEGPGRFRVVDTASPAGEVLRLVESRDDAAVAVIDALVRGLDPGLVGYTLAQSSAGISVAELAVLADRRRLVEAADALARRRDATETAIQELIGEAWWLFGGRYVRVLQRRDILQLDQHDIPLITADGALHIVELKGPAIPRLVKRYRNHWIVGTDVHEATSQAANYIRTADENALNVQTSVAEELGIDVKLRRVFATVVIGHRDHLTAPEMPAEQFDLALRSYNASLNRVQVVTYDQLFDAARRSLQFDVI